MSALHPKSSFDLSLPNGFPPRCGEGVRVRSVETEK